MRSRCVFLFLLVATLSTAPAFADVVPPGRRGIEHDVFVGLGDFADRCHAVYEVEEGDTLGHIAQRTLGSAREAARLAAHNGLALDDPLEIGSKLQIPPRDDADAVSYHLFVLIEYPFHQQPSRLVLNRPLPFFKFDFQLCAVVDGHVEEFLREAQPGPKRREQIEARARSEKGDWLAVSRPFGVERTVSVFSLTRSKTTRLVVTALSGDELELQVVRSEQSGDESADAPAPVAMAGVALGAAGILLLVRRRRTRT